MDAMTHDSPTHVHNSDPPNLRKKLETTGYDTRPYWVADAHRGTEKLLNALIAHHDFNVTRPDGWKPHPKPSPKIAVEVIIPPPSPRLPILDGDDSPTEPKIADIKRATCRYFGVSKLDMDSARRTAKIVYPRQIAMYLARTMTAKSFPEIGRRFGGRDHTTVIHGNRKIEAESRADWRVAFDLASVEAMI